MIVGQSTEIPEIHGLILLDCWEPPNGKFFTEKFYVNLIDQLQGYNFRCVVNGASNNKLDIQDPSLINTLKIYSRPRLDDSGAPILDTPADFRRYKVITNLLQFFVGNDVTSALIKRYLLAPFPSVFLMSPEDLAYHASVHLHHTCKNWLVVGQSWQMCTHSHALGLPRLAKLSHKYNIDMSFYATDFGFCKVNGGTAGYNDFENDSLQWEHIENFGYKLVPEPQTVWQFPAENKY
jgi:hypothetical protein